MKGSLRYKDQIKHLDQLMDLRVVVHSYDRNRTPRDVDKEKRESLMSRLCYNTSVEAVGTFLSDPVCNMCLRQVGDMFIELLNRSRSSPRLLAAALKLNELATAYAT